MCGLAESGRLSPRLGGTRTRTLLCGFRYRLGSIQMRRPSPVEGKTMTNELKIARQRAKKLIRLRAKKVISLKAACKLLPGRQQAGA